MKLKLDAAGHVVVQDDKPVYIADDGKEVAFDAAGTIATISRLNGEAKGHREGKEAAESRLKTFEGLDAAAAREALDKISKLDAKKLIDAGEVDKVRQQVRDEFKPVIEERDSLRSALHGEKIGNAFARSKVIADKLAIPADFVQAKFGNAFGVENGKIVAKADGQPIYSRSNPGELASFDEALEILIDRHPDKNSILRGVNQNGSGARPGSGKAGGKSMTRGQFDQLNPVQQAQAIKEGTALTD